ncbi:unnamed protein product, partial [Closterium sp. NIES-53]
CGIGGGGRGVVSAHQERGRAEADSAVRRHHCAGRGGQPEGVAQGAVQHTLHPRASSARCCLGIPGIRAPASDGRYFPVGSWRGGQ